MRQSDNPMRITVTAAALLVVATLSLPAAQAQEVSPPTTSGPESTIPPGTTPAATVPTPARPSTTVPAGSVPSAPADLVGAGLDGGAELSWAEVTADPPVTAYVIRRDGAEVGRVDGASPTFAEEGLLAEEPVTYTVAAVNDVGEGPASDPVIVVPTADTTPGFGTGEARAGTAAGQTERRVYRYSIARRGSFGSNLDVFALHVAQTLNDPRGWSLGGSIEFRQVPSGGDFTVWLSRASAVPSFSSVCSATWSCRVGRNVIINETRWRSATSSWLRSGGSLDSYRHYVVIHEAGHWLGFGHSNCPGSRAAAPVMMQQSKGLNGCRHNGWPTGGERSSLSRRTGAPARPWGAATASFRWGRPGDVALACDWNGDGLDTPAIVRGNRWYVRDTLSRGRARAFTWGRPTDTPVCGNWNGRGGDGIGVVRGREWILRNSATAGPAGYRFLYGSSTTMPVVGDWDGRGGDSIGRVANGRWVIRNSVSAGPGRPFRFGRGGDGYVVGDWDGDGRHEPGVVRGLTLYQRATVNYRSGYLVVRHGRGAPLAGRWDGLAVDKPGQFSRGIWALRRFSPIP